jgi:hypothetical protein
MQIHTRWNRKRSGARPSLPPGGGELPVERGSAPPVALAALARGSELALPLIEGLNSELAGRLAATDGTLWG